MTTTSHVTNEFQVLLIVACLLAICYAELLKKAAETPEAAESARYGGHHHHHYPHHYPQHYPHHHYG